MRNLYGLLILLLFMFVPFINVSADTLSIDQKSYNKTSHVFNVQGNAVSKYTIVMLYNENEPIAMYVAETNDGKYNANIKVKFASDTTVTVKVGDINGTAYSMDTLDVEKSVYSLKKATTSGIVNKTYTGAKITQTKLVVKYGTKTLVKDTDYTVSYDRYITPGKVTMTITGKGNYVDKLTKIYYINKAAQPLTLKKATKVTYASTLRKRAVSVKPITILKRAGTLTYTKISGSAKLTVNKTTGYVTVKKGTKKGTYSIKVKVNAAGNVNYKAGYKTVIAYVKVR